MKKQKNIFSELFSAFFRIGLFTIGGGYAMLPMLHKEVVDRYHWATEEEIMDYYAIGQSTPGVIAINTATFVGYKKKGVLGGIVATLGMVVPSWFIIITIAIFYQQFANILWVQKAFMGIRVVVVVLIVNTVIKMGKKVLTNYLAIGIFILAFLLVAFLHITPIYIIITSGILGIILNTLLSGGEPL